MKNWHAVPVEHYIAQMDVFARMREINQEARYEQSSSQGDAPAAHALR